ncbi:MAG: hypothetical protein ACRC2O_09695 [Chitinophagaceae bacterium]
MGSSSSHNNGYSREDLLRYISGQMLAAEMHALEKAALEDPFLADALDGLQQEKAAELKKNFAVLDQRLSTRVDHKIIPFSKTNWWRIAIAAALIGFLGIAAYFFHKRMKASLSLHKKQTSWLTILPLLTQMKCKCQGWKNRVLIKFPANQEPGLISQFSR